MSRQEFSLIQDMKSFFDVLVLISNNEDLRQWKFVQDWNTLSIQEKLKKYDKECCHEFNLFAYFKDKTFFEGAVLPFLQNKKEKDIIDHFLLGNEQELQKHMVVSNISNLNIIHKILLYMVAVKTNVSFAQAVLQDAKMRAQMKVIKEDFFKRNFDSILQSCKMEEEPSMAHAQVTNFMAFGNISNVPQMTQNYAPPPAPGSIFGSSNLLRNAPMKEARFMDTRPDERMRGVYDGYRSVAEVKVFKPTEATVEYRERTYYKGQPTNQILGFWFDLMDFISKKGNLKGFFSKNFVEVQKNFSEILFLYSIIDLPFEKQETKNTLKEDNLTIHVSTPLLVLTKEIIEEQGQTSDKSIMVQ